MKTSIIFTFSDLCSQGIELLGGRLARVPCGRQLPFTYGVHSFYSGDRTISFYTSFRKAIADSGGGREEHSELSFRVPLPSGERVRGQAAQVRHGILVEH
jgi:hypothetical protein